MCGKPKFTSRTGVKSTLYPAYSGPFPDPHVMVLPDKLGNMCPQPGICKTLLNRDKELTMVEPKFGPVPYGSVLFYQCPPESSREVIKHLNARTFLQLPIENYRFLSNFNFTPSYRQRCHLECIQVTAKLAATIEESTRPVYLTALGPGTPATSDGQQVP